MAAGASQTVPVLSGRLGLRPEGDSDRAFLLALYGSTRAAELRQVGWSAEQRDRFIAQQFEAQRTHYRQHYRGADFLVIEYASVPVGRLYLHLTRSELRLMDIIVQADRRGQGLGRRVLLGVVERALEREVPITLHVEPFNPARHWYQRLGFERIEARGVYWFMRLPTAALESARSRLSPRHAPGARASTGRASPTRFRKS